MTAVEVPTPNIIHNEFWVREQTEIEKDLASYRANTPVTYVEEPLMPPESPLPQGAGTWILSRHAEILEASRNPEIFSSAQGITILDSPPEFNEFFSSMIVMDDPRHARLRRIVSAGFTPRMLNRLEKSVQQVASDIVDGVCERGEIDFVVDVAAALPLKIVCDLMGIPKSHYQEVFDCSNVILGASDPEYVPPGGDILGAIFNAGITLQGIMEEVAESKRGMDSDDLTTTLVNAKLEDDTLTTADIAGFFILLVVAGNETTRNAIGWGLKYLTDNPEQKKIWIDDFENVAPSAVEEIVRLASPVTYMRRTTTTDTTLGNQEIKKGEKVCMFYLSANRDEEVFENPYKFDVLRQPNNHLGFGGPGPHFCLGAHLARREITVMFRELLTRLPDIQATGEPEVLASSFIHGVKHLPASFTPQAK
ncbi:MAG: cytochrome P450 [Acidimicrobiales bacterium]|jgi:cytochrome P450|nr:cytochrome P450 [Acidimicrobiales bacterium]MDP6297992.1 cytochrome P450 [Acidimicrobiales bacterium]HJM28445.1 cytochrome P450 [Acidimicrobiales bacterium]HJM96980.1 cytochrome P450 [Acidimicrobiales bacterium]